MRAPIIHARCTRELESAVRAIAKRDERTFSGQIRYIVEKFVEKDKENEKKSHKGGL